MPGKVTRGNNPNHGLMFQRGVEERKKNIKERRGK
jgi:hypothetical protein